MIRTSIIFLFLLLCIHRVSLVGQGALSFPDETRYLSSVAAVQQLMQGHFPKAAAILIQETAARPVMALMYLPPAIIQAWRANNSGVISSNPQELKIPQYWNVLVSLFTLLLLYVLFKRLLPQVSQPLIIGQLLILALYVNQWMFVPLLVPYMHSFLLVIVALFIFFSSKHNDEAKQWRNALIGVIALLAFLTYPGSYLWIPIFGLLIFVRYGVSIRSVKPSMYYALGIFLPLLAIEAFSSSADFSFLAQLSALSDSVTLGSFEEGLIFPFRYLWQVEGLSGGLLLILVTLSFVRIVRNALARTKLNNAELLFAVVMLALCAHALQCYFLNKMVFYGRLLYQLYPFLILGSILQISSIRSKYTQQTVIALSLILSLYAFSQSYTSYNALAWPRDQLFKYAVSVCHEDSIERYHEINSCIPLSLSPRECSHYEIAEIKPEKLVIVNFCGFFPVRNDQIALYQPTPSSQVLIDQPLAVNFKGYLFEGYTTEERAVIQSRAPRLKIFRDILE